MRVILEYSDADFKRLEERAFINSRTIGEYIRKIIEYPANSFNSWRIEGITSEKPLDPILEPLVKPQGEPEVYLSDKPHRIKRRKKRKYIRKIKEDMLEV